MTSATGLPPGCIADGPDMGVAADILASWTRPRSVMRKHLQAGQREDRALVFLMLGCAFVALSQLPTLVRRSEVAESMDFGVELGGVVMAWLFIAPLAFYAIAAASHIISRALKGKGTWYGARLALFWSLLAAGPVWLVNGLVTGFLGKQSAAATAVAGLAFLLFVAIWLLSLIEAEYGPRGSA